MILLTSALTSCFVVFIFLSPFDLKENSWFHHAAWYVLEIKNRFIMNRGYYPINCISKTCFFFSHPDFTVGFGITPNQPNDYHVAYYLHVCHSGRGLYRRSGITPCPEEFPYSIFYLHLYFTTYHRKCQLYL